MKTSQELIKKIENLKAGDNKAFNDIYEESYRYLHTCVIHIVKNEDIAQDMLQDTYVEIYKNISQLKQPEDFLSWASTIANRKCFAYIKKDRDILAEEKTDDEGNETDFFESVSDDESFIPENIFDNRAKIDIIRGIIDDLSDVQRACVIGFYYNEQKQDEIAEQLGIPVNTVKSHLNRAKAKIKNAVGDVEKKQGIKLYSIAPFMLLLFGYEAKAHTASTPAMGSELVSLISSGSKASAAATGKAIEAGVAKSALTAVKTKIAIGAVTVAVGASAVAGIAYVNNHQKTSEPAVEISESGVEANTEPAETGPSVEELEKQAREAIDMEDYDAALVLAKEAGAIDKASETRIKDMVKAAYSSKIDEYINKEEYDAAYSLINEGNDKLGSSDLDSKLDNLPYAVANGVNFTTIDEVPVHTFIHFYEEKEDGKYRITDPAFTYDDMNSGFKINAIELQNTGDGCKEYTISATIHRSYTVSHPYSDDLVYWFSDTASLSFFDYYSGQILKKGNLDFKNLDTSVDSDKENLITWQGNEYSVWISAQKSRNNPVSNGDTDENGITTSTRDDYIDYTYTIRCPEDYDGLCISLPNVTKMTKDTEEKRRNSIFDDSGRYIDNSDEESNDVSYMFKVPALDNEIHTPDFYRIMRITDDVADKTESETAKVDNTEVNSTTDNPKQTSNNSTQQKADAHDSAYYEKNIPVEVIDGHQNFLRYEYVSQADIDEVNAGYGTNPYAGAAAWGVPYSEIDWEAEAQNSGPGILEQMGLHWE